MIPGINAELVFQMIDRGLSASDFFDMDVVSFSDAVGFGRSKSIGTTDKVLAFNRAKQEVEFVERHGIKVYSLFDDDYPGLLRQTPDAPVVIYKLGDGDLNGDYLAAVVGTRRCTAYGVDQTRKLVEGLKDYLPELKVVSGLAYGIDTVAHQTALETGLTTIAVMATGLDTIYPSSNRDLARRIVKSGGALVSEYPSGTPIFRSRFLERNRIVAGLSHFTMVMESEVKGGAMSTANLAFNYGREVGALPGRSSDLASQGCNQLIRRQKASLVGGATDVIELMGWTPLKSRPVAQQLVLFPELTGLSAKIYEAMRESGLPMSVDAIFQSVRVSIPEIMSSLTELEFDGVISRIPGNRYVIN